MAPESQKLPDGFKMLVTALGFTISTPDGADSGPPAPQVELFSPAWQRLRVPETRRKQLCSLGTGPE